MMYTFYEQIIISIKFILLGMFMGIMLDMAYEFNLKKKIPNIIMQILFWIMMAYIICIAVLAISDGYIPIYTFLFFIGGYFIYYKFLKQSHLLILKKVKAIIIKNRRNIANVIFPKEVIKISFKIIRFLIKHLKKFLKKIHFRKKIKQDILEENSTIVI